VTDMVNFLTFFVDFLETVQDDIRMGISLGNLCTKFQDYLGIFCDSF